MLVALLLMVLLNAVLATVALEYWATARQRERETELLFVGDQYRRAIQRYYFATPSGHARLLPAHLEDLLNDERFPTPVQHLRRLYPDPITGSAEWGLELRGDRIAGVYSNSEQAPIKQVGFDAADAAFEARSSYKDWVFVFVPRPIRGR